MLGFRLTTQDQPAAHHEDLVWHPGKKIVYYQASAELSKRKVRGRYKGSKGRAFFTPYHGKDDETKVRYCRHYAAGLHFRRWAGQWYLEINPTYTASPGWPSTSSSTSNAAA